MTTIVVVRKGTKACIAADSLTSFGDQKITARHDRHCNKIQRLGQSWVGIAGYAAHALVLEHAFGPRGLRADFSGRQAIFNTLLQLHPVLKEKFFLRAEEHENDAYESSRFDALIANEHGIFGIYSMREVYEFSHFWALGSGSDYALGAMHTLYDTDLPAEDIALAGVRAGCCFDNASAEPIMLEQSLLLRPDDSRRAGS